MNSQRDDEKLDRIKVESPVNDPQAEQRSLEEQQGFEKRSPAANAQFLQEKMRVRNERRIEKFEVENSELQKAISSLKDETKIQHGELERLRERSSWRSCLSWIAIAFAGIGALAVKYFDKSDTSLHWGFTGHAWFLLGLALIGTSVLLNLVSRKW